jgi:hypothetical protein
MHSANTQAVVWEPRIGIAWRPFKNDQTVIRMGAGIFADELPGLLAEDAAFNPPGLTAFTVANGNIAPGAPGSLFTTAAQANQAFLNQFELRRNTGLDSAGHQWRVRSAQHIRLSQHLRPADILQVELRDPA